MISPQRKIQLYKLYYSLTFIGTVFHEIAHKQLAESRGLKILDVSYFSLSGGSLGSVTTSPPRTYGDVFAVNVAPFVFNSVISVVVLSVIFLHIHSPQLAINSIEIAAAAIFGLWFSGSLLLHSVPSSVDISNISKATSYLWEDSKLKIITVPLNTIQNQRLSIRILLSPIEIVLDLLQGLLFVIRHLNVVITLPAIKFLHAMNMTKKYGSHIVYTAAVIVFSYSYIAVELSAIYAKLL